MKKTDVQMLEEAYLSMAKKMPPASLELEPSSTEEETEEVEVGPMDELAPGVEHPEIAIGTEMPEHPTDVSSPAMADPENDPRFDVEDEEEEDQMTISNLSSIRESITKIASFCAGGGHVEVWAQQKLAIAMDNLAEVARRLPL